MNEKNNGKRIYKRPKKQKFLVLLSYWLFFLEQICIVLYGKNREYIKSLQKKFIVFLKCLIFFPHQKSAIFTRFTGMEMSKL